MKRAILVDDEPRARKLLTNLLATYCGDQIQVVGEADGLESALEIIRRLEFDVLFLDIQLKFHTGFELLTKIELGAFQVIFVTAYDQYAIRALRFSALDYLLKPIKVGELTAAVDRLGSGPAPTQPEKEMQNHVLQENLNQNQGPKRIVVPNHEGYSVLKLEQVLHMDADSNYTHIYLIDGTRLTVSRTLKNFEELLQNSVFFRIHNRHLVNLVHITDYLRGDGGAVRMSGGKELPVSRNRKHPLLARLNSL